MKSSSPFRAALPLAILALLGGWQIPVPGQDPILEQRPDPASVGPASAAREDSTPVTWETFGGRGDAVWTSPAELLMSGLPNDALMDRLDALEPEQLGTLDRGLASMTEALAKQYAKATDEERREEIEPEISFIVDQHFEVRHAIRDREIAELEKKVASLRERLEQRKDAKQQIMQGRVDQLIRSARGLGWDGQAASLRGAIPRDSDAGSSDQRVGEVSGVVTFRGQPLSNAFIVFVPLQTGRSEAANIADDGKYRLPSPLRIGIYKIYLAPTSPGTPGAVRPNSDVPSKYWSKSSTDLSVTIEEGENIIDLELTSS